MFFLLWAPDLLTPPPSVAALDCEYLPAPTPTLLPRTDVSAFVQMVNEPLLGMALYPAEVQLQSAWARRATRQVLVPYCPRPLGRLLGPGGLQEQ